MTIAVEEGEDKDADYADIQWRKSGNQWKGKKIKRKRRGKSLRMIEEGGKRENGGIKEMRKKDIKNNKY